MFIEEWNISAISNIHYNTTISVVSLLGELSQSETLSDSYY